MSSTNFAPCHHRRANGTRCGSPALRGEQFCYHHHPTRRPMRQALVPPLPVAFDLPPIADHDDAQVCLAEIMRRIADATLDIGRANLLLQCLQLATGYIRTDPQTGPRIGPDLTSAA